MAQIEGGAGGLGNDFVEMGLDPAAYEALEKDFQEVLHELVGDQSMERFRNEYEKLHRALKTSYESEKRLVKRCKELNDTILQNATRVKAAIKLTQDDAQTITILRHEVDKAWKLVEQAKEKEEKARKIIQDLRNEIAHLNKIVEQGSGLSIGQDNTVHNLMRQKDELKKECDQKQEAINELDSQKSSLMEKIHKLENDLLKEKEDIEKHKYEIERLKEDKSREERKNKYADEEKKNLQNNIADKEATIKKLEEEKAKKESEIEHLTKSYGKLEATNKEKSEKLSKNMADYQKLEVIVDELQRQKAALVTKAGNTDLELSELRNKLKQTEKDNKLLRRENISLLSDKDRVTREKVEALHEKNITKAGVNALTREIEYLRKQVDFEKGDIVGLVRDRDMMKKNITKAEEDNQRNKEELIKMKSEINTMSEKNRTQADNIQNLLKQTDKLEKERDKFSHEASKANANLMQMVEEVKLKKNLISELKKENIEFEGKLKQQQNLYEAVRSDRNLYSKNLIEAQDEVAELKRKFKIASHQISQLKDEIEAKDQALTNEHHDLAVAKKEADAINGALDKEKKAHEEAKSIKTKLENEIQKLTYIIKEAHEEHEKLKKDYQNVINERDILGTQLIRRNDELALLYEKIKILQSTLAKGEVQYQERLEDIRLLKFKIADLKSELRIVKSQASQIGDLRKEVYNLQQQLLTERLQGKALSEELENPLNYHRWRKLEGTDPDTWEMLQKIQTLQKRLIKKTEEVVEKDVVIQEKEKLYIELKNLLARQPGPEVAEQLSIYQQNLKEKTRQMKAMASELNMYQAQVNEYKYEIEKLTRELQDMKRKYYEQKKREQQQMEAQQRMEPKSFKQTTAPVQRFTGGGFNLAFTNLIDQQYIYTKMSSQNRKNIHEELDELVKEEEETFGGFEDKVGRDQSQEEQATRPSKVNKKKRKKQKKKKVLCEVTQLQQNDKALPSTPLKYKLAMKILILRKMKDYQITRQGGIILCMLGWGHFSTVWLARDITYNTYVALKIQRSSPHYLEAAFDEVEILDQVSSYWMKPQWLASLKKYYSDQPERLKKITGSDSYCVQLLNCFLHHGPHGKHFVMVFEILGVNLLEVIKRYNYKGVPMPIIRRMAEQCLIGLDYLHRICKIIHTDLKPENVNLCLSAQEVEEIAKNGRLTTTKMYHQAEDIKKIFNTATLDPLSFRGRKENQDESKASKQQKRAEKKKRKKQRKKEKKQQQQEQQECGNTLQTEEDKTLSPNKKPEQKQSKFIQMKNKNYSTKPSPFTSQKQSFIAPQQTEFSLKSLNPSQMKELNQMLEQFVDVPRSFSLPKIKYNEHLHGLDPDNEEDMEILMNASQLDTRYDYDISEYEKFKNQLEEFLFFRKKFEQSQRAMGNKDIDKDPSQEITNKLGIPNLNLKNLDPRKMQQEIEEEKAKRRGPKLDESLKLKICDLGNGCWTYHHFSTEIQTRQYRSPEVIIGSKYGASADIWSFACMIFEMATGDFLFEPRKGKQFDKDDDHLAQMMELLGRMPQTMALSGRNSKRYFDQTGHLRRIRGLNHWPLKKVLVEKYKYKEKEALAFADFLTPLLEWNPEKRATAQQMLSHPWLKMESNYDYKMTEMEYQIYQDKQIQVKDAVDNPLENVEMSKVGESDSEENVADLEDNDRSFYSDLEDDGNPYFDSNDEEVHPKEYRDIAEGKNINNSFVGPYPENWDHLHIDKGPNPQFLTTHRYTVNVK